MALDTLINYDLTGNELMASAVSIDPADGTNITTTKQYTVLVSSGLPNVAVVSSGAFTKYAGSITLGGAANTILTSSGGIFTLTINNANVEAQDQCFASVMTSPSSSQGIPAIANVTPSSGALVIEISNVSPSGTAFSGGQFTVNYIIFKN